MDYITAGESHGPVLTTIVSGVPAGLTISEKSINADLARRQSGYGRGGRQAIEKDTVQITSGVRFGVTMGSPITLSVPNRDWKNWQGRMDVFGEAPADLVREVTPRPGHADLLGVLKNDQDRSGNRPRILAELGVEIHSYVVSIGDVSMEEDDPMALAGTYRPLDIEMSEVRCPDEAASEAMMDAIDRAKEAGDTLGGTFRVVVTGLLPTLGGYETPTDRLTSKLGGALFSIPAIKGVEFGLGFEATRRPGSRVHDEILLDEKRGFVRASNNAGGLEGGMTTGMPLVVTVGMKPIATLTTPLETVNLDTLEVAKASKERSDTCAVPAAAVVAESEVALVIADAYLRKFGSDNMTDIKQNIASFKERIKTMSR